MENKRRFREMWRSLEEHASIGLVKRLFDTTLPIQVYATFLTPGGHVGIGISFSENFHVDIASLENLDELKITMLTDNSIPGQKMLHVQLAKNEDINVFSVLCEDLVATLLPLSTPGNMIQEVINQLHRWKNLFGKSGFEGLTKEEQQGLYGELYLLRKLLHDIIRKPPESDVHNRLSIVIRSWTGPGKTCDDFQGKGWAVEVKTTSDRAPRYMTINGEHQLDNALVPHLFIYHLTLELSEADGESLPMIVRNIRELLKNDMSALDLFEEKLFEANYLKSNESLYTGRFYKEIQENHYKVSGDFPRITPHELRKGVSDVIYKVSIDACDEYLITERTLLKTINSL